MTTDTAYLVESDLNALAETTAEAQRRLDERDLLVIQAFARGASLRRIAEAAGMSHVGVKKLVDRLAPDFAVTTDEGEILAIGEAKAATLGGRRLVVTHTFRFDPSTGEAVTE